MVERDPEALILVFQGRAFQGDQEKSLFNSSLRASFPARLAAAVVSK
jgi:hypothetical protein